MQEKNVRTYAYYFMKSALNLCATLYEWWQPQYHIHCTYNTFIFVLLLFFNDQSVFIEIQFYTAPASWKK